MGPIIFLIFLGFFLFSPLFRLIMGKFPQIYFYGVKDIILYFKNKKWKEVDIGAGITCFIGMFGHGKTLSMTKYATSVYQRYGDKVRFISNYHLTNIPYIPLVNFEQIVKIGEEEQSNFDATVILIDEIELLLSHRNFSNFPLTLLSSLMQQRKLKIRMCVSCQRWFTVDRIFRSITTDIYDCNKYWRFQHMVRYDAWDYENAMNFSMIRPTNNVWWFVTNKDFESYDTKQMISRKSAEDFISNEETIVRVGLDNMSNPDAVRRPRKQRKDGKKKR